MNMTSNDEEATRNPKRARADDGSNSGGSAATPTSTADQSTLADTLGSRLQPMTSLLASQPEELKGYLISSAKDMLAKATTIRQRKQSVKRFTDPWIDPKTNKPHIDETSNQPKSFIPNSLRSNCPIKASPECKDESDIMTEVNEAKKFHEAYQQQMAIHAHNLAKLEIKHREKKLQNIFFDHSYKFALCMIIHELIKGIPEDVNLSREEFADKAVYDVLGGIKSSDMINALFEESAEALQASYATYRGYKDAPITERMMQNDNLFLQNKITTNLTTWLPLTSTTLWIDDDKREMNRKVNSELRKALKPAATAQATEDVAMAIGDADGANNETMMEVLKKEARAEAKKEMQRSLQKARKKSSGGDETLEPTPTKPGRNGGGNSSNNSSKKSKKKKKKDGQKKSGGDRDTTPTKPTLKKGTKVRFSKSTTNRKSGSGSRGGSNRGGKGKSSGRS